jgi:hypothetical protein
MWDKLGAILELAVGCYLIFFCKRASALIIRKQLEERTTMKTKELRQQLKEMQLEGILHKILEVMAIVIGVGFVLLSISGFFPQAKKYVAYLLGLFALSFFAAGAAALVEFLLLFRFLWRKVRKYNFDHRPPWHRSVQNSSGSDKLNITKSGPTDDPILRALEKKAIIYSIVCFIPLFAFFLFAFYIIYRVTS